MGMIITTITVITMTMRIMAVTITTIITMMSTATTSITAATPMLMTTNSAGTDDARAMSASEAAALYRLMTWLSPSFPVGAFSYSSGIEWAVEAGDITDAATLARLAVGDADRRRGLLRRRIPAHTPSRA